MINFFWVVERSKMDYKIFEDVVTFDATYKTNQYNMQFTPSTGLTHHFHLSYLVALCCKMRQRNLFKWLFRAWLEVMNGKVSCQ